MPDGFEFEVPLADVDTGWLAEESIADGPTSRPSAWRPPKPRRRLPPLPTSASVAVLAIGLAVAAGISLAHPNRPSPVATPDATPSAPLDVNVNDANDVALAAMISAAHSPIKLANFAIENNQHSNCRPGSPSADPAVAIAATVIQYQPTFSLLDSATGLEQSGTCSVRARFTDGDGTTIIVTVLPPPNVFTPNILIEGNDELNAIDVLDDVGGWKIEVGAVGPPGQPPGLRELDTIATDARIHW